MAPRCLASNGVNPSWMAAQYGRVQHSPSSVPVATLSCSADVDLGWHYLGAQ